ncbi:MAG: YggT family protein [Bacillota bacterium]|jgi:YggT family protein
MGPLRAVLEVLMWVFILRVVFDFIPAVAASAAGRLVHQITEPVLAPMRRFVGPMTLGETTVDIAPIMVLLALYYLQMLI